MPDTDLYVVFMCMHVYLCVYIVCVCVCVHVDSSNDYPQLEINHRQIISHRDMLSGQKVITRLYHTGNVIRTKGHHQIISHSDMLSGQKVITRLYHTVTCYQDKRSSPDYITQ